MVYVDFMADRQAKMKAEEKAAIEKGQQEYLAEQRRETIRREKERREEADTSYSSTGRFGDILGGRSTPSLKDWDMLDDREKRTLCATQGCKRDRYSGDILGGPYCRQCADEGFLDSISGRF